MKNYKGTDYKIHIDKLRDDLGYIGYGIVHLPMKNGFLAKMVFSENSETYKTRKDAKTQLDSLVKKYIDQNAGM